LKSAISSALLSAALFGVTTPLAKHLLTGADPILIAGLLYLGSGIGLSAITLLRARGRFVLRLSREDWPWLAAAIAFGGVLGPALLMLGLSRAHAAVASLLLNLEAAFTALIAWMLFHEATSPRVVLGFGVILAGSVALFWPTTIGGQKDWTAMMAIAGACLCWGIDNNLTRRVSGGNAPAIAALKGLAAGITNVAAALVLQARLPDAALLASALVLGFLGYGLSLVLFIVALRNLGTARTSAYFATAPFIGGALAIVMYRDAMGWPFWIAAACMAAGVWLHLTEQHEHEHVHEPLLHTHAHWHDLHHQHEHPDGWDGMEPHVHEHYHAPIRHSHPHFPDLHHRHTHRSRAR